MWIRLTQAHAVFFPGRLEPAGSIVSIGGPKGAALVAAGLAEPAAQPPGRDDSSRIAPADGFRTPEPEYEGAEFPVNFPINFRLTDDPKDDRKLSAQADALVAALGAKLAAAGNMPRNLFGALADHVRFSCTDAGGRCRDVSGTEFVSREVERSFSIDPVPIRKRTASGNA